MELQFEKTVCRCLRQAVREIQNQEQTQEVKLSDGMPDIGRVLSAWGQIILRSKEWRGSGMSTSGGVMAWVMYVPEDGSEPRCLETWIPFQTKWDFPETEREGSIRLVPLLRGVDARTLSARKVMLRVSVGILGEALEPWQTEVFTPGAVSEDIQVLRHTYPVRLPREAGEKTFLLDEELTLPASCPAADKILRFDILPQIQDQKVMAGKVVFRGAALLHVLYRSTDGTFAGWDFEIPFSQFADLEENLDQDPQVGISPAVTSLELDLTEDGMFRLKCGIVAQYVVSDRMLLEVGEDAYSPRRSVVPHMQTVELPAILDTRTENIQGEKSADLENGRVVDVSFLADHPHQRRLNDRAEAEIGGIFQILYENGDGALESMNLRWEQNWAMEANEEEAVCLELQPTGRPQTTVSGGLVTAKCTAVLTAAAAAGQGMEMMNGMETGEMTEPDPDRPSLILRRMGQEDMWELAKKCGTTVAAIRQANGLTEDPRQGQMLLIPVL